MNIFLATNTDGWNEEGIGSIVQWNILLNALAQDLGVNFCANTFRNLNHYQYNGFTSEEWSNLFTKFFNFEKIDSNAKIINYDGDLNGLVDLIATSNEKLVINISKEFIVNNCFSKINEFGEKGYFSNIRKKLVFDDDVYFDEEYLNISLHLRSTNPGDIPPDSPPMETFGVWIGEDKICNLIDILKKKYYNKTRLYIHSQGALEKFSAIQKQSTEEFQIILKLNELPTKDLYHMSYSDVLILARSSYSWISHLFNENLIFARDNFHQPLKSGTILLNSNYTF
jgi:hypothetical protein